VVQHILSVNRKRQAVAPALVATAAAAKPTSATAATSTSTATARSSATHAYHTRHTTASWSSTTTITPSTVTAPIVIPSRAGFLAEPEGLTEPHPRSQGAWTTPKVTWYQCLSDGRRQIKFTECSTPDVDCGAISARGSE
jgi:hypothetical protein